MSRRDMDASVRALFADWNQADAGNRAVPFCPGYLAVPFVTICRNPGVYGLTITFVSGPTTRLISRARHKL